MIDRRPLYVLVALVVVVGAIVAVRSFSGGSDNQQASTATTSTSALGPPVLPGDDWQDGLVRVTAIENALYQKPDPSGVDQMMLPECSCYSTARDRLAELVRAGQHVDGDNISVKHSVLQKDLGIDRKQVVVVLAPNGRPTVDNSGRLVEQGPSRQPPPFTYILVRGSDDAWRIADRQPIGDQ